MDSAILRKSTYCFSLRGLPAYLRINSLIDRALSADCRYKSGSFSYEKDPDLYLQSAERARSIREFMRRYAGRPLNEKQYVLFRNIAESITKTYLYFPS